MHWYFPLTYWCLVGCRSCDSMFGKKSLLQSCRFHGCFSRSHLYFATKCLPSLDGGKVLASQLVARKTLVVLGYSVASSAQGDHDSGEYSGLNHHILNKNGLFIEVAFFLAVGHCLAPGFDSCWSCLQPGIAMGSFGCFPPVQGSLLDFFLDSFFTTLRG